jgi:hypothetical protein
LAQPTTVVTWSCHCIDKGIESVARREYQVEPLSIHNTGGKLERRYTTGVQRLSLATLICVLFLSISSSQLDR